MAFIRIARLAIEQMKKVVTGRIVMIGGMTAGFLRPCNYQMVLLTQEQQILLNS